MRDQELDLIAALAEGSLEDETEARALLAGSAEARAEYEAQQKALMALASVEQAKMSDTERSGLHRDLWTELTAEKRATKSKTPWYYRWTPVAASLFVVVGLVAVINQSSNDQVAETFNEIGSSLDADGGGGDGGASATTTQADSGLSESGSDALEPSAAPAADEAYFFDQAAKLRQGEHPGLEGQNSGSVSEDLQACVDQSLSGYLALGTLPEPLDFDVDVSEEATRAIVATPEEADLASSSIAFVNSETCELLHIDE